MRRARQRKRNTAAEGPDPLDLHIGQRIRRRRLMLRLKQKSVAEPLGISFQAVQKYESGAVRVAAATLFRMARLMGVTLDYFVAELPAEQDLAAPLPSDDEFIIAPEPRSDSGVSEEEWVTLRAVRPLTALPPAMRDEMINHIRRVALALGQDRDTAGQEPPRDG